MPKIIFTAKPPNLKVPRIIISSKAKTPNVSMPRSRANYSQRNNLA